MYFPLATVSIIYDTTYKHAKSLKCCSKKLQRTFVSDIHLGKHAQRLFISTYFIYI